MSETAYLLLGSNLGNCLQHMREATLQITKAAGKVTAVSSIYKTAAWGNMDQPDFLNQVLKIETSLSAQELLDALLNIEVMMGRKREKRWESRLMDLDILYFGNQIIATETLQIPHPHLHQRRFTLVPLCEISPEFVHPILGVTNKELLNACEDPLMVEKL
jgi:2-amino-4-hydroxy-6-hydroxymethyldihydropteridine diphosphokinase